jgi:hypothetical protein
VGTHQWQRDGAGCWEREEFFALDVSLLSASVNAAAAAATTAAATAAAAAAAAAAPPLS